MSANGGPGETRYVLHDGDDWFYCLGSSYGVQGYYADGEPMEKTFANEWWATDHKAKVIEREWPAASKVIRWKLMEGVTPTEEYPATLTLEEYSERDGYEDGLDARMRALYDAEREEIPSWREVVEGPFTELKGSPPPKDGLTWSAKLPYELRYASEYRHLFPGKLTNFRAAVAERLSSLPGVSAYDHDTFSVYVKVRYDKPVPGRNLRNKKIQVHESTQTVPINPPRDVEGSNRAEAKAKWDRLMEEYVAEVGYWTEGRICSTCHGTGLLDPKKARVSA